MGIVRLSNRLVQLELYHLRLPFRSRFSHAAAERDGTDTVVAAALLADGTVGFGEGLPRHYVTGETVESVLYNISDTLGAGLGAVEPGSFAELLELADNLPFTNPQGKIINAARCCVELALLDAYSRYFGCGLSDAVAGWLGYGAFTQGGSIDRIRVSGVLDGSKPGRLGRRLRLMRWYGLRDFKLKLGCANDQENLEMVYRRLKGPLRRQQATLRVDANGAWDIDTATAMCSQLVDYDVCCVEQPLSADDNSHMHTLASMSAIPLMADESLLSLEEAQHLAENDLVDYFNIRISKNGGLLPALRLAETAGRYSLDCQLGAMVGESGLLAAAGRNFLQIVPDVAFTEISYSTFLLKEDIVDRGMRFGYAGRLSSLEGPGLGVDVNRRKLSKYTAAPPKKINLA